jgi:hypothetical protein
MVHGEKAMATHWGIMQAACNRWHGIQEEIADRPVSGADFECKVCLLDVSIDPGSPSFDLPVKGHGYRLEGGVNRRFKTFTSGLTNAE